MGVSEEADSVLTTLQNGQVPARKGLWRMLKGKLGGIGEVRINDGTNTFRIYVWLGCDPALYVLDAGMKKRLRAAREAPIPAGLVLSASEHPR